MYAPLDVQSGERESRKEKINGVMYEQKYGKEVWKIQSMVDWFTK